MLKQQLMQTAAGLMLLLTLLGGVAQSLGATTTAVAQVTTAHHALADVDPIPPGH